MNVRIPIEQLVAACRCLGEVLVVAAGSLYATLKVDEGQLTKLSRSRVPWSFDK